MPPKRKRSPRARSRSRSPEKKRAKSPPKKEEKKRTTKTSQAAAARSNVIYGTGKQMNAKLRSELTDKTYIPKDLFNIMEQYGNFHECDGPTDLGKLCLKGKDYFKRVHKMNCSTYCGEAHNCHAGISTILNAIPQRITVTNASDGKERTNANISDIHFDFITKDSIEIDMTKTINKNYVEEIRKRYKIEKLNYPYVWHVTPKEITDARFLPISDKEAIEHFCQLLREGQLEGQFTFNVRAYYKAETFLKKNGFFAKALLEEPLPEILSDNLVKADWYADFVTLNFEFKL
jgi:hypothetical protein